MFGKIKMGLKNGKEQFSVRNDGKYMSLNDVLIFNSIFIGILYIVI